MKSARLLLLERTLPDGSFERTWLEQDADGFAIHVEGDFRRGVPIGVLDAVMKRYGKPLADDVPRPEATIESGGIEISVLRHRARYDVIARDFLVYSAPGAEPLAELTTSAAAALLYLLRPREES